MSLLFEKESYMIRGCALEVHKELGCGFLEKVYQDALEIEFRNAGVPYEREKQIKVQYKGETLMHDYYADFVCYESIIIELKAVETVLPIHKAQTINYLKATGFQLGFLINFGEESLNIERLFRYNNRIDG
ncbi:MAG: GxxExxY protein [Bacteroidaceae bacterium]|nr:GxxExxY protein [Bacteroidaceae bacterium]